MLIFPLYAIMFQDSGLEPIQIAYLFMAWKVTSFILEFPSGITADLFSRKKQLILAEIMIFFGYLIWMLFPNFWGFFVGFILWGAKAAFVSGTLEAFIYDELKAMDKESLYTKIYGRLSSISTFSVGLAALLTFFVFNFGGYPLVLLTCVISNGIATLILFTMKEVPLTKSTGEKKMFKLAQNGFKEILNKKDLLIIVIFTALIAAIATPIDEYTNLLVVEAGLKVEFLGIFTAASSFLMILGGLIADKFENFNEKFHYFLVVLSGSLFLVAALLMNQITILLFLIEITFVPIVDVIFEGKSQKLISSEMRATVSSIRTFLGRIGSVIIIFIIGIISQSSGYKGGFIFLAALSLMIGIGFMGFSYFKEKKTRL